jgi:hypothetical protein
MAPESVRFFDRLKFLWDGETYGSGAEAGAKKAEYESQGFETRVVEEEGASLLYTRRVVKDVVVEGQPPSV